MTSKVMPIVHIIVSTQRFASIERMREFIDPTYTEDGDLIPSPFFNEVQLANHEPACIEVIHVAEPTSLQDLLGAPCRPVCGRK